MSTHRDSEIDRVTAERLLRGDTGGPPIGPDALVELLAAAAAPGHLDELVGEQAALTAFRQAHLAPVGQPRRGSMIKVALAKILTTKIALAAAAATAVGGGAVAVAATGNLPASLGGNSHTQSTPSVVPSADHSSPAGSQDGQAAATPSPSMVGLCRAYSAGVADSHGKALDNPAFSVLITNAGGADGVADYCATVLANKPGNAPSTHPTGQSGEHGEPSTHPTGPSSTHPTAQPTEHPTGQSGEHGQPTTTPIPTATPSHSAP